MKTYLVLRHAPRAPTGAYVDVVLSHTNGVETFVDSENASAQTLQKRSNSERQVPKRLPHAALGGSWQLKDGGSKAEAAFVAAAYEWWEAGATAVGGAAAAGITRSEM